MRTMEDAFHDEKPHTVLTIFLTVDTHRQGKQLRRHARSRAAAWVVHEMGRIHPALAGYEVADVHTGQHPAMRIAFTSPTTAIVHIDHRLVGGTLYYRWMEVLSHGDTHRAELPAYHAPLGLAMAMRALPQLIDVLTRKPHDPEPLIHTMYWKKRYSVCGVDHRRFRAYHAVLADVFDALDRDVLRIMFTVVFRSNVDHVVNNVGVVVLDVHRTHSVEALERLARSRRHHAVASRFINGIGRRMALPDAMHIRERIDVVITSFYVDATAAVPFRAHVHAAGPVYGRAYVCMLSRQVDDATTEVTSTVSTSRAHQRWHRTGYHPS